MAKVDERLLAMTRQQHQVHYVMRSKFTRKGATAYIGHLDLMGVFSRAVRKTGLPLLYSQGFNPRPELVFALPMGVGINTEGDWVDISMATPTDAEEFMKKTNEGLPNGLEITYVTAIDEPKRSLMSVVTYAEYALEAEGITQNMIELFKLPEVMIEKTSKGKTSVKDIRDLMIKLIPEKCTPDKAVVMVCAGSSSNLRPDVLLNALCAHTGYDRTKADDCIVTRLELYGGTYPDITGIEGLV